MRKEISSDVMATILILDKRLEPQPEPFRCQPSLQIIVSFEEYIKFIQSELGTGYDWLYTPTSTLQSFVRELDYNDSNARKKLFTAFLNDMSMAAMKELCIAEALGKRATKISHSTLLTDKVLDASECRAYCEKVKGFVNPQLAQYLSQRDYALRKLSGYNTELYDYAVTCKFLSDKNFYWSSK